MGRTAQSHSLPLFDAVEACPGRPGDVSDPVEVDEAVRAGEAFLKAARMRGSRNIHAVRVEFRPFRATLFSFRILNGVAQVKLHSAFRQAPDTVLDQAAHLMLNRRRNARRYGSREAFDAFVRDLPGDAFDQPGARRSAPRAQERPGVHRSLQASFERVNERFFAGKLPCPMLCWSPVRARRIVATYEAKRDRIVFTRRLDAERVPEFVLDFVMYHELLHKALGIGRRADGKRRMHGAEFRRLERRFPGFKDAEGWLRRL